MSLDITRGIARYSEMTDPEKAEVRSQVFRELSVIDDQIAELLSRASAIYSARLASGLESFVTTNAADFSTAESTALVTARARIRGRFATAANAIPGVSGATVG